MMLFSTGICIGITSVFLINAISNLGINSTKSLLDRIGLDGYLISTVSVNENDIIALSNCKNVQYLSTSIQVTAVTADGNELKCVGGNSQIEKIYSLEILRGDFFDSNNILQSNPVCVISSNCAKHLFNSVDCLGQHITININSYSQRMTIIGIYKSDKISENSNININEPIYMPYTLLNAITNSNTNKLLIKELNQTSHFISLNLKEKSKKHLN